VRTHIYVDGFNFYYGAVRGTQYKWVDFKALFSLLLQPHHLITKIKYFTALVKPSVKDPDKRARQLTYIRALESYIPEIEVIYGHFLSHTVKAPLVAPVGGQRYVDIIRAEEKGSDVNLAVHLLNDAWLNLYDCAVVVSNDSDLAEPLRLVKIHHSKAIGVITPHKTPQSYQLSQHASFKGKIREGVLRLAQLPNPIPGTTIFKPPSW
jgi:hypothetical protein